MSSKVICLPHVVEKIASELSGLDLLCFYFVFVRSLPPSRWEEIFFSDGNYQIFPQTAWFKARCNLSPLRSGKTDLFPTKMFEHCQVLKSRGSKKSSMQENLPSDKLQIPVHESLEEELNLQNPTFVSFFSGYNVPRPFQNLLVVGGNLGVQILGYTNKELRTVKFFPVQGPPEVKISAHRNMLLWEERKSSFILSPAITDSGPSFRLTKLTCWPKNPMSSSTFSKYFEPLSFQDGSLLHQSRDGLHLWKPVDGGYKLIPITNGYEILFPNYISEASYTATKVRGEYYVILKKQSYDSELVYTNNHQRRSSQPRRYTIPYIDIYRLKRENDHLKLETTAGTHRRIIGFKDHYIHGLQLHVSGDQIFAFTRYR